MADVGRFARLPRAEQEHSSFLEERHDVHHAVNIVCFYSVSANSVFHDIRC